MNEPEEEVWDEAKNFLKEVREVINEAQKIGKKVEYVSDELLILSLMEGTDTVYEVLNKNSKGFASKVIYIGDKKLASSYLLNLIHKQEIKVDPHYEKNI